MFNLQCFNHRIMISFCVFCLGIARVTSNDAHLSTDGEVNKPRVGALRGDGCTMKGDPVSEIDLFEYGRIDDDLLADLANYPKLRKLTLAFLPRITNAGLKPLAGLQGLHELAIYCPKVDDDGLRYISKLTTIEHLELSSPTFTDDGFEYLKGLTRLKSLHIGFSKVTDRGLSYFSGCKDLRYLNLDRTLISDKAFETIERFQNLEVLNLDGTKTTNAGFLHFPTKS